MTSIKPITIGANTFVPISTNSNGITKYQNSDQIRELEVNCHGTVFYNNKNGKTGDLLTKFDDVKQLDVKA